MTYTVRSFLIYTLNDYYNYWKDHIRGDEMGAICSVHGELRNV